MFRQDIPELNQGPYPFEKYGCKLCSYFFWLEQVKGVTLQIPDILETTKNLVGYGFVTNDLAIYKGYELHVPQALGINVKKAFRADADYLCKDNEIEILWLSKPGYSHFVPGDGKGNYVWDSLGRRPAQKQYRVAGKRIMVL